MTFEELLAVVAADERRINGNDSLVYPVNQYPSIKVASGDYRFTVDLAYGGEEVRVGIDCAQYEDIYAYGKTFREAKLKVLREMLEIAANELATVEKELEKTERGE